MMIRKTKSLIVMMCMCIAATGAFADSTLFTVTPEEYPGALSNPMKGFRAELKDCRKHPYATLARHYIKWNELENDESDDITKIRDFCNTAWAGVEEHGIKVIPRVYLDWDKSPGNEYWPADLSTGDYSSEKFKQRLQRLIERLGACWDNDPRVAWVQMGLIGYWGEHHSPGPSDEMQILLGDAFTKAFKNKKFLVRHATEFSDYKTGIYWDSWAHIGQMKAPDHGAGIEQLNRLTGRWKTSPIEGETAYNWGNYMTQPGDSPNDTLADPQHLDFLLDTIRNLHCSGLGWVSNYDPENPRARAGAEKVQKAFGYRLVVKQFSCSKHAKPGGSLTLSFSVVNTGSAPFYEDWPLEFSLLNPETGQSAWSTTLERIRISHWLPGDDWDEENKLYRVPPETYTFTREIPLPGKLILPEGEYIAALAVLDPAGNQPALRFAVKNQNSLTNGRHPFGRIGVGVRVEGRHELNPSLFSEPLKDRRLGYTLNTPVPAEQIAEKGYSSAAVPSPDIRVRNF
jgi:hypothetical protein